MISARMFFRKFVILFGFLNGLWVAFGIDPKAEIFGRLQPYVSSLDPKLGFYFTFLPIALLVFMALFTYSAGKWIGMLAVILGFIAGMSILVSPKLSLVLVIIALFLGYFKGR